MTKNDINSTLTESENHPVPATEPGTGGEPSAPINSPGVLPNDDNSKKKYPIEKITGFLLIILTAFGFGMSANLAAPPTEKVYPELNVEEIKKEAKTDKYEYHLLIPYISGFGSDDEKLLNGELAGIADSIINRELPEDMKERGADDTPAFMAPPSEYDMNYLVHENYFYGILNITLNTYKYKGGMHGMDEQKSYYLDLATGKRLGFDDIFIPGAKRYFENRIKADIRKHPDDFWPDPKPNLDDADFYFYESEVVFVFREYSITSYMGGMPEFRFQKADIQSWLKKR